MFTLTIYLIKYDSTRFKPYFKLGVYPDLDGAIIKTTVLSLIYLKALVADHLHIDSAMTLPR